MGVFHSAPWLLRAAVMELLQKIPHRFTSRIRATLPGKGSSSLVWYLTGGGYRFYDLRAGGYVLSQLVGNYQKGRG